MSDGSSPAPDLRRGGSIATALGATVVLLSVHACGGGHDQSPPGADTTPTLTADSTPLDSLVLSTPLGEVWLTGARPSRDSTGRRCVERSLEIRRGDSVIAVPLLYTGRAPGLANDSTLRAELWLHCRPVSSYQVDLRTGAPSKAGP